MILIFMKIWLKKLWPAMAIIIAVNMVLFSAKFGEDSFYLPGGGDMMSSYLLYSLESIGWAVWLHWSASAQHFYRQYAVTNAGIFRLTFSLFVVVSLATQFLPMLLLWHFSSASDTAVYTDILGFCWLWLLAILGYFIGMAVSLERKWHSAIFVVMWLAGLILLKLPVLISLPISGIVILFFVLYASTAGWPRRMFLAFLYSGLLLILFNVVLSWDKPKNQNNRALSAFKKEYNLAAGESRRIIDRSFSPNFIYESYSMKIDWVGHKVEFYGELTLQKQPDYPDVWQQNKAAIETAWWQHHRFQTPLYFRYFNGAIAFAFKEAIYVESETGVPRIIWQANNKEEFINWTSITPGENSRDLIFGNDKRLFWVYQNEADEGVEVKTLALDSKPLAMASYIKVSAMNLMLMNKQEQIEVFYWEPKEGETRIQPVADVGYFDFKDNYSFAVTNPIFALFSDFGSDRYKKQKHNWLAVGFALKLFSILVAFMLYRLQSKTLLFWKLSVPLVFGLPGLVALLICFGFRQSVFSTRRLHAEAEI